MKKAFCISVAALCLLGCSREFHDPLLRQQLTTTIAGLNDVQSEKKAISDLEAILSVNSSKMSKVQKDKLTLAIEALQKSMDAHASMEKNFFGTADSAGDSEKSVKGFTDYFAEQNVARKLISELAGTL